MISDIGVLFAGGKGLRMGGLDKGLIEVNGRPLFQIMSEKLLERSKTLVIVAPRRPDWMQDLPDAHHVPDWMDNGMPIGPAGGLLAGLNSLAAFGRDATAISAPIDLPFLPVDVFDQLAKGRGAAPASIARSAHGLEPVIGVWSATAYSLVREAIILHRLRALRDICSRCGAAQINVVAQPQAFSNLNTPEDVEKAQDWH